MAHPRLGVVDTQVLAVLTSPPLPPPVSNRLVSHCQSWLARLSSALAEDTRSRGAALAGARGSISRIRATIAAIAPRFLVACIKCSPPSENRPGATIGPRP